MNTVGFVRRTVNRAVAGSTGRAAAVVGKSTRGRVIGALVAVVTLVSIGAAALVSTAQASAATSSSLGVLATINLGSSVYPQGVAVSGNTAYVADSNNNSVAVINLVTGTVTTTIPVGIDPQQVVVSGGYAYVPNMGGDTVSVISTASNTVTATVPSKGGPSSVAVRPDGSWIYVTNTYNQTITDFPTSLGAGGELGAGIPGVPLGGGTLWGAAVGLAQGNQSLGPVVVYVALHPAGGTDVVEALSTFPSTTPASGLISGGMWGSIPATSTASMAVSPNGTMAYLPSRGGLEVINVPANPVAVTTTIPISGSIAGVAVSPDGSTVYVASAQGAVSDASGTLSVINAATNTVTDTIPLASYPLGVAAGGSTIAVTGITNNVSTVSVIGASDGTNASPTITSGTPPVGTAGQAYGTNGAGFPVTTTGTAPVTFSATGLPPGLSIDASTGVISGTPTTAGTYSVTVSVANGIPPGETLTYSITIQSPPPPPLPDGFYQPGPGQASLAVDSLTSVPADGTSTHTVYVWVGPTIGSDGTPTPVGTNAMVQFSAPAGVTLNPSIAQTNAQGIAMTEVTSTTSGTYPVTATAMPLSSTPTTPIMPQPMSVLAVFGDSSSPVPSVAQSSVSVDTGLVPADGTSQHTLAVAVKDANGNPLPNQAVTLSALGVSMTYSGAGNYLTTNAQGVATATLTSKTAGSFPVTASVAINGVMTQIGTATAVFTAVGSPPSSPTGTLTVDSASVASDGVGSHTVTATVNNASGSPESGVTVNFTTAAGATLSQVSAVTNSSGVATTQVTSTTAGTYSVSASASDATGVVTFSPGSVSVVFTTPVPASSESSVSVSGAAGSGTVVADGASTATVTVSVKDANGVPLPGQAVSITATPLVAVTSAVRPLVQEYSAPDGVTVSPVTDNGDGSYTASLTSTVAGGYAVTASVLINGTQTPIASTTVLFTAPPSPTGTLTVDSASVASDGVGSHTVTATVNNASGTPESGVTVNFTAAAGASLSQAQAVTNSSGVATTQVTSTTAGTYSVSASASDATGAVAFSPSSVSVVFTTPVPSVSQSSVSVDTGSVPANGSSTHTVTVSVKDANGVALPGQVVTVSVSGGVTLSSVADNGNGTYTATLTAAAAGTYPVTASVAINGTKTQIGTATATFTAVSTGASKATLAIDSASAVSANGSATHTVTVTVVNATGSPVSGVAVTFTAASGAKLSATNVVTNSSGVATTTVTSTTAGTYAVSATATGVGAAVTSTGAGAVSALFQASTPASIVTSIVSTLVTAVTKLIKSLLSIFGL